MRYTEKSRYFAITEFHNSFITRSQSLFFNYLRSDLLISSKSDRKKEKNVVSLTHEQNIIYSLTQLDAIAHEQTIIWRQSLTGNVVGSRPIKRKKNLHRMIIRFMQNLARELSVGVTDCITMGDWKTKNWELQNFHGLKKKWRFSTQVQKDKLGICLFTGSLGELQQVSTSLP